MKAFKKLKIGRKIEKEALETGVDSVTQLMNFTRMKLMSKTMRILDAVIDHPSIFTQDKVIEHVYGFKRSCRSWGSGLFSALHHHRLIDYVRKGRKFMCVPTEDGKKFYESLFINEFGRNAQSEQA